MCVCVSSLQLHSFFFLQQWESLSSQTSVIDANRGLPLFRVTFDWLWSFDTDFSQEVEKSDFGLLAKVS